MPFDYAAHPLPMGLKWSGEDTIQGTLPGAVFPAWNYGWVERVPETREWLVCLWLNQKNTHTDSIIGFASKEEALNYLWLKFTLEHGET